MTDSRWISAEGNCVVNFSPRVLEQMIALADAVHPLENGASLFGQYANGGVCAVVEGITVVPRDSQRGRFHFHRGIDGLAPFFRRLFNRTRGKQFYVGEFHSHPGGAPQPSSDDDATQFAIAADGNYQCSAAILVIIGGEPGRRDVGVYVYTRARERLVLRAIST